jgi:hypothetical protein
MALMAVAASLHHRAMVRDLVGKKKAWPETAMIFAV